MRKMFVPQMRVPGATPQQGKAGQHLKDKRGRYLWNMPAPISFIEQPVRRRNPVTHLTYPVLVKVPVYAGMPAKEFTYQRCRHRRIQRKLAEVAEMSAFEKGKGYVVKATDALQSLLAKQERADA